MGLAGISADGAMWQLGLWCDVCPMADGAMPPLWPMVRMWLRGSLYGARHSVSLDPNNVDRLCRHMCPCCRRTCTCVADSYVSTTSVRIANLATKVVHFVVLMGIWRIDLCYAALWLWAIGRCLVLAVVAAHGPSLGDTPAAI